MKTEKENHDADDRVTKLLAHYEKEQHEFENHWLWRELGTTPALFFKKINECVEKSGIDQTLWRSRLNEAKAAIETRVKEQVGAYKPFALQIMRGVRV